MHPRAASLLPTVHRGHRRSHYFWSQNVMKIQIFHWNYADASTAAMVPSSLPSIQSRRAFCLFTLGSFVSFYWHFSAVSAKALPGVKFPSPSLP
ncbi:hypothetical protein E2542_SST07827 [Spatholobus suberectus]|nr:hypothetical protein E2542_SST07827 [Spatholobus suberectus]